MWAVPSCYIFTPLAHTLPLRLEGLRRISHHTSVSLGPEHNLRSPPKTAIPRTSKKTISMERLVSFRHLANLGIAPSADPMVTSAQHDRRQKWP